MDNLKWFGYGIEDGISAAHCWKKFREIRPYENIQHGFEKIYFDGFWAGFLDEMTKI